MGCFNDLLEIKYERLNSYPLISRKLWLPLGGRNVYPSTQVDLPPGVRKKNVDLN